MVYYAVRNGFNIGVYTSWEACKPQVTGYSRFDCKKFYSAAEAHDYCNYDNEENEQTVYTDGACTNNGQAGARAGIGVYWGPNDSRNVSERHDGRQTNNSAEIHAAIRAIEQAHRDWENVSMEGTLPSLNLRTDSRFLVNGATKWMYMWRNNGWKTANGGKVKNKEDFQELFSVLCRSILEVNWIHVKAHTGNHGNDEADRLACEGCYL